MKPAYIREELIRQKKAGLSGNLYYDTQISFAYNSNHMEGSTITLDETASIFDTGSLFVTDEKTINVAHVTEISNHFRLFNYMLDTYSMVLNEDLIKEYHRILKEGTYTYDQLQIYNVGEYKKYTNKVGGFVTVKPEKVADEMDDLLTWYNSLQTVHLDQLALFHARFESIHPFQDGNGRVGRMILFKECLKNDLIPFVILDETKAKYYSALRRYQQFGKVNKLADFFAEQTEEYERTAGLFLSEMEKPERIDKRKKTKDREESR